MNICFFLISDGWGGAENVVYNLAKFMEKKRHNINIILNYETYNNFKNLVNVNIYNLGPTVNYGKFLKRNFIVSIPSFFSELKNFSKGLRFILSPLLRNLNYRKIKGNVLETINKINPDVIHFHNPFSLEIYSHIFHHLQCPVIFTGHGAEFEKHVHPLDRLKDLKKKKLLMNFDEITAVSEHTKRYLTSNGISSDIKVIYNGIDLKYISSLRENQNAKNKHGNQLDKKQFILLFPGGMKYNKGGLILLRSMEILNSENLPIRLYYAGITTKIFVEKNKIENVTFTGFLQHKEYLNKLDECDCLILPSEIEEFSIAIAEAMGLGKTIITAPTGGTPEFCINRRNGLYTKRTPEDLAEKIIYLYKNYELRKEISKNNINDSKKFDWDNIVNRYIELYESVIKN